MAATDEEKQQVKAYGNVETPSVISAKASDTPALEQSLEDVPDGGLAAWTVVLGSTLALIASTGMANAYGAFQDYYESTLLPSSSSASIALIGSLQYFLLFAGSPLTGRIFDAYGITVLMPLGSFLCVLSMMMASLAQKDQAYQLFLSHGVLFGVGMALMYASSPRVFSFIDIDAQRRHPASFNPSIAVLGHWFRRRRATAIGVALGGSSIGGVIFPILLQRLVPVVGFPWAVRSIAFVMLACFVVSCLTVRTRLPLSGHVSWRTAVDLHGFKDLRYVLAAVSGFLLFYAVYTPIFYIEIYASFRGVSPTLSSYLLPILNAANVLSRILPGLASDRFGALKCFVPAATVCTVLVFGLWMPSRNVGSIIAFSVLYGLFSGVFLSLLSTHVASITPREVFGARLGSVYVFVAIATLAGTPTAGALLNVADEKHFERLIVFTGAMLALGTVVLVGAAVAGNVGLREKLGVVWAPRGADDDPLAEGS
ncbi:MFS general substrate transporter [Ganoderma sinense ZZ0214-1]|uniref:MFS general substrate transporter n=1 Tax=Ganoderma sinense ZZ0214-1 TaxID=1077348 RepID=A0A2G8S6U5_9APHY|nr:MFS general substrate transporter [Ganoderma sinense ZZ0214-1]